MLKEMTGRDGIFLQSIMYYRGERRIYSNTFLKLSELCQDTCICSTSPISRGRAPMAFCSALTSSLGPTIRDVPVSTIAWQPALQRVSWLPTVSLWGQVRQGAVGWGKEKQESSVHFHHRAGQQETGAPAQKCIIMLL